MARSNPAGGDTFTKGISSSSHHQSSHATSSLNGTETNNPSLIDEDIAQDFMKDAPALSTDEKTSSVKPLPFNLNPNSTPTFDAMHPHLVALEDEHSSYLSVSKACLFLNQLASYGSSSITPPSSPVIESNLFETTEYTTKFSTILNALSSTSSNHSDRRCRILALNSLALISKAIVAKLVITPVYLNHDDVALITRLQDEICNDVVMNMVSCALEDDDGVAAVAFESLGRLVTDVEDDLFSREVRAILGQSAPVVFAPVHGIWDESRSAWNEHFASSLQELDCTVYNSEIRWRILQSVLAPRIRKLFNRIQLLKTTECKLRCLPFMNVLVMFAYTCKDRGQEQPIDKETFAHRWFEFDTRSLVQEYVETLLIPLLRKFQCSDGAHVENCIEIGLGTATNALMLCSVVHSDETWLDHVISLSIHNLERGLYQMEECGCMEQQMTIMAALLIALRGMNIERRVAALERVTTLVVGLPSTRVIPQRVMSAALEHADGSRRKPARFGFWTEIALSFLLPDKNTVDVSNKEYSSGQFKKSAQIGALSAFLESTTPQALMLSKSTQIEGGTVALDPTEEMIFSFCSVAHTIGRTTVPRTALKVEHETWIGTSLVLLQSFMPCLNWKVGEQNEGARSESLEQSSTLLFAAQRAYIELFKEVLVHAGTIMPSSSIFYHFMSSSTGTADSQNPSPLERPSCMANVVIENDVALLLDRALGELTKPNTSRKNRLSLVCLLTDSWIRQCQLAMGVNDRVRRESTGPVDLDNDVVNINERHARNLLSILGSEISSLIAGEKKRSSSNGRNRMNIDSSNPVAVAGEELRCLLTCISCVESMAYTAQLSANHFIASDGNVDDEESARYIVSVSMVVLKGQGKTEAEDDCNDPHEEGSSHDDNSTASPLSTPSSPPRSPRSRARITAFTSECADAAKRLRNFVGLYDDVSDIDDSSPVAIDFNCLCPLFKRSNFGVPFEDKAVKGYEAQPSRINEQWNVTDRIALVDYDIKEMIPFPRTLGMSISYLLDLDSQNNGSLYDHGILFHICRQQLCVQTQAAITSRMRCDWKNADAEPRCLRRIPGMIHFEKRTSTGATFQLAENDTVSTITGCSEPLAATLSYSVRRTPRFDGEIEFKFVVTVRVHNITPVPVLNGLHLNLIMVPKVKNTMENDSTFAGCNERDRLDGGHSYLVSTVYKTELKGGHHLTWEVVLDFLDILSNDIRASITLQDVAVGTEVATIGALPRPNKVVLSEEGSVKVDNTSESQRRTHPDEILDTTYINNVEVEAKAPAGAALLPNPQVFCLGRKECGDEKSFIFLWQSMSHSLPALDIPSNQTAQSLFTFLTESSSLAIRCNTITGQQPLKAWALTSWCGKHLLALSTKNEMDPNGTSNLYIKSNDAQLLGRLFH